MRRGIRLLVPALVLTAGVTACSDDPTAGTLPTASPGTTAPTTAAPTLTASASADATWVEAAVHAYYRALEAAVHDPAGKLAPLEAALDPACRCAEIVRVLREEAERGRHADYTLTVTRSVVLEAGHIRGTAQVTVAQSAGRLLDRNGRVVERISALTQTYFVEVARDAGQPRVVRVTAK